MVDNSEHYPLPPLKECRQPVRVLPASTPSSHAAGLRKAVAAAAGDYILALDVDTLLLSRGWEAEFLQIFEKKPLVRLLATDKAVTAVGQIKPCTPLAMFFEREFFLAGDYGLALDPESGNDTDQFILDTGVRLMLQLEFEGYSVNLMPATRQRPTGMPSAVAGCYYALLQVEYLYHHAGSRFFAWMAGGFDDIPDFRSGKWKHGIEDIEAEKIRMIQTGEVLPHHRASVLHRYRDSLFAEYIEKEGPLENIFES